MSDLVTIHGLRVHGWHGVHAEERQGGQLFVVDAELTIDTLPAAQSDDLHDTVDYAQLIETLNGIVGGEPVELIETLAQRLATACLADARVESVRVTVHKPEAPVRASVDDITVTIVRGRV